MARQQGLEGSEAWQQGCGKPVPPATAVLQQQQPQTTELTAQLGVVDAHANLNVAALGECPGVQFGPPGNAACGEMRCCPSAQHTG